MTPDRLTTPDADDASTIDIDPPGDAIAGQDADAAGAGGSNVPGGEAGPVSSPLRSSGRRNGFVLGVALTLIALLGGGGLFVSGYTLGLNQGAQPGTSASDEAAFKAFWDTYHNIEDRYALASIPPRTLVDGAIGGMVQAIGDPYSTYLGPDAYRATLQDLSGSFEGIGTEIGTVDSKGKTVDCNVFGPECRLSIVAALDGSPAQKAGLKPGDVITTVDGATLDGLTPDDARNRIRGPSGTSVTLHIERAGTAAFDVAIVRAKIQEREVITKDLGGGSIGYVRLTDFSEAAGDAFVAAVKADVDKGDKRLIVDLRGNPGGFIDVARKVASAFIGSGPIFWEEDAHGVQTSTDALPGGVATDASIKLVVLIDHGSASASEIVAGALKDTARATLVGETSFGKGTVQQWIDLGDDGGVKLTIAKWLTPDKHWIHKIGIVPDVPVTVPTTTPAGTDPVLDKAVSLLSGSAGVPEAWLEAA